MKSDITSKTNIKLLVDTFYNKAQQNEVLAHIFNDVVKINWDKHLPKMYSFWASLLLQEHSYNGNPMKIYVELSKMTPMNAAEFSEWVSLFYPSVDELFEGSTVEKDKTRVANIAQLMQHKIEIAQ